MPYAFGAQDVLSVLGITAEDWEVQESGGDRQKEFAGTKDKDGLNVAAAETGHNDRTDLTLTLKSINPEGATASFVLGGVGTAGVVITQFAAKAVAKENGTLTITAHRHEDADSRPHIAGPVAQEIEVVLGFGVLAVYLGGTLLDCQSSELSGSVVHVDKNGNQGQFLVGASTGLRLECTEEYVDSGTAVTVPAPWFQDSQNTRTVNEDFYTRAVKAHAFSLS